MAKRVGRWQLAVLVGMAASTFVACGGGDDGTPSAPPPPNPLYVRATGSDQNSGADPANALRSIVRAAALARRNYTIIVGPGTYTGGITAAREGAVPAGLMFVADTKGSMTGDDPGPVVVDALASSPSAGFSLSSAVNAVIDGFTIQGGRDAGIVLKSGSDGAVIDNCTIARNDGDGIRVQDSAGVVVFNNLIYRNGQTGLVIGGNIRGSADARVYSNTIVNNNPRNLGSEGGITIGTTQAASPRALVYNNIIQNNGGNFSIRVRENPRSDLGYAGNFNLVLPSTYSPASIRGADDLAVDAQFRNQLVDDYLLLTTSPAIDQNSALPGLGNNLAQQLRQRTTTGLQLDRGLLDLGFHFPRGTE